MYGIALATLFSIFYGQVAGAWTCDALLLAVNQCCQTQVYRPQEDVSRHLGGDGSGYCGIAANENLLVTLETLLGGEAQRRSLEMAQRAFDMVLELNPARADDERTGILEHEDFFLLSTFLQGQSIWLHTKTIQDSGGPSKVIESFAALSKKDIMGESEENSSISKLSIAFFERDSQTPVLSHSVFSIPMNFGTNQIRLIDSRFPYEVHTAILGDTLADGELELIFPNDNYFEYYQSLENRKKKRQQKAVELHKATVFTSHRISESDSPHQSPFYR